MSGFILKTAETDVEHVVDWSKGYLADREKIAIPMTTDEAAFKDWLNGA